MTCPAFIPSNSHCLFRGDLQHPVYGCKHATGILCPSNGVYEVQDTAKFQTLVDLLVAAQNQESGTS